MSDGPTLVELGKPHLHDLPALLRNLAGEIEAGAHGEVVAGAATFLLGDGGVFVCGWGRTDDVHSIGLLQIGASWLATHRVER